MVQGRANVKWLILNGWNFPSIGRVCYQQGYPVHFLYILCEFMHVLSLHCLGVTFNNPGGYGNIYRSLYIYIYVCFLKEYTLQTNLTVFLVKYFPHIILAASSAPKMFLMTLFRESKVWVFDYQILSFNVSLKVNFSVFLEQQNGWLSH